MDNGTADARPLKRRRLSAETEASNGFTSKLDAPSELPECASLQRPISPPIVQVRQAAHSPSNGAGQLKTTTNSDRQSQRENPSGRSSQRSCKVFPSPFQLTRIRDLPPKDNVDAVGIGDIVGDPLIRELWHFNYLFDLDFVMEAMDEDVRALVQVKIVHGFWKSDDMRRLSLEESARRFPNVQLVAAYMPEPFGTHHSKMTVLLRHDDLAQVVIHTANMIPRDWTNMCQAVWRSPLLPLLADSNPPDASLSPVCPIGSGVRFKVDLLRYLNAYGSRTRSLADQLQKYDFSAIRAAFVASVPGRVQLGATDPSAHTSWGWVGLKEILSTIKCASSDADGQATIVAQVSSIASLGQTDGWLNAFFDALAASANPSEQKVKPARHVIFPTAQEIRTSLDGYMSGGSIHMKIQSAAQQKQLRYLRPMLCRWADEKACLEDLYRNKDIKATTQHEERGLRQAGRAHAAPHIKTYVRYAAGSRMRAIDWAMVTSANLSMQAWGALEGKDRSVRVCSWETGVIVWPGLWEDELVASGAVTGEDGEPIEMPKARRVSTTVRSKALMVPTFGSDTPDKDLYKDETDTECAVLIGFRMPYNLPLTPYDPEELPWCATAKHTEPDWMGRVCNA